jgi:hypothetical protein
MMGIPNEFGLFICKLEFCLQFFRYLSEALRGVFLAFCALRQAKRRLRFFFKKESQERSASFLF